jgi:hypothetical protein
MSNPKLNLSEFLNGFTTASLRKRIAVRRWVKFTVTVDVAADVARVGRPWTRPPQGHGGRGLLRRRNAGSPAFETLRLRP